MPIDNLKMIAKEWLKKKGVKESVIDVVLDHMDTSYNTGYDDARIDALERARNHREKMKGETLW